MKMKVLHVLNSPSIGGIETFVYYLTQAQQHNPDLEISLLFSRPEGNLKSRFIETGAKCYFLDIKPFDLDLKKYKRYAEIAAGYDILHLHTFLPMRDLFASPSGTKKIFTQHSVAGFGRVRKTTDTLKEMMLRNFLNKKVNYVTYNSYYTQDFWGKRGIQSKNSKVIYNGVTFGNEGTPAEDPQSPISADSGKFIIGTSSRFIEWKRVDLLIRAFAIFQKDKPEATLLLVGDGLEMDNLKKLTKELQIEQKVIFTGYTTYVTYYQSLMDISVFPSTTEAFGLVAIECMHLGKPVLVFEDGGGITELIRQIEPENVVRDVPAMAEAFERFYQNRTLLKGAHLQKRIDFSEKFDMKIAAKQFHDIYADVMQ